MHRVLFLLPFSASLGVQGAQCRASSPSTTTALVELYTSEGCDSCPPADRWLSSLGPRGFAPDRVVPIALHVDYWDYIGWKDPYARQAHSARQRKMAKLARAAMVYTPQVLLQGWISGPGAAARSRLRHSWKARLRARMRRSISAPMRTSWYRR